MEYHKNERVVGGEKQRFTGRDIREWVEWDQSVT